MPRLELLRPDHAPALLAFEQANRSWFAASVPDRGDDYFARFEEHLRDRLSEQATGLCFFHVLVDGSGAVLGRVNLVDAADGSAELGYRIAEHAAGRGLATAAVRTVCALAGADYGLTALHAVTARDNHASRTVLTRTGFVPAGDMPVDGRPGLRFVRELREVRKLRDDQSGAPVVRAGAV